MSAAKRDVTFLNLTQFVLSELEVLLAATLAASWNYIAKVLLPGLIELRSAFGKVSRPNVINFSGQISSIVYRFNWCLSLHLKGAHFASRRKYAARK